MGFHRDEETQCNHCGEEGLRWTWNDYHDRWELYEDGGNIHACPLAPEKQRQTAEFGPVVIGVDVGAKDETVMVTTRDGKFVNVRKQD